MSKGEEVKDIKEVKSLAPTATVIDHSAALLPDRLTAILKALFGILQAILECVAIPFSGGSS